MNQKSLIILVVIIVVIVISLVLNFTGYFPFLNTPLNIIVAGTPDTSCVNDFDCHLAPTTCGVCDCGESVNKEWQAYCPFENLQILLCKNCVAYTTQCIEGQCQKNIVLPER